MVHAIPRWARIGGTALLVLVTVYMFAPLLVVVGAAFNTTRFLAFPPEGWTFDWFAKVLSDDTWISPFLTSIQVALITALVAAAIGTMTALAVTRHRFPGSAFIQSLAMSPLIIPSIIFAIGMLQFSSSYLGGPSQTILTIAHIVITIPYVLRTVMGVIARSDRFTEEAARVMGASWWRRYWHILLPMCRPGIVAGAFLAFIVSFDDAVIALFVRTPTLETLPMAIYSKLEFSADPAVAAVSTLSMALTAIAIIVIEKVVGLGKAFS
ncbi:ABC transporter permease [Ruicaihuangia caeni]|uniref:ABC transporter permease n=1 Tax=Ruicaihuangia caeni TaxID=3042517 RepID=A0AAW6T886_9MICO|nr:ABC transporter permease [Klugiella sp. YN-L-19]MDI2099316.1 ABC transporter permease [Klugiella sp. YN-L-19]